MTRECYGFGLTHGDSPAHVSSFDCNDCDRSFDTSTRLDVIFRSFPTFNHDLSACRSRDVAPRTLYNHTVAVASNITVLPHICLHDPSLPPATLYANLWEHEAWRRGRCAAKRTAHVVRCRERFDCMACVSSHFCVSNARR